MSNRKAKSAKETTGARERILKAAAGEIYKQGFQGMRVDAVLEKTSLTKGAFYHHFASKRELGLAVIDEIIYGMIKEVWFDTLREADDPVTAIQQALEKSAECFGMEFITLGCPLNNLAQEMSPIDEEFRLHVNRIFQQWREGISGVVARGVKTGNVVSGVDPDSVALFVLAGLEGSVGLSKNERDLAPFLRWLDEMERYLDSLRPHAAAAD